MGSAAAGSASLEICYSSDGGSSSSSSSRGGGRGGGGDIVSRGYDNNNNINNNNNNNSKLFKWYWPRTGFITGYSYINNISIASVYRMIVLT